MTTDQALRLVYRDLDGRLTAAERTTLRAWEQADPANRRAAAAARQAWQAARPVEEPPFDLDVAADFERVRARTTARPARVVSMRRRRSWLRIAAALAFLAISVLALRLAFSGDPEWVTVRNDGSGAVTELSLPDGSIVYLKGGGAIAYPPAFNGATRPVRLEGEAFFEVAENAAQPFTVRTDALEVTVLGTAFNVRPPEFDGGPVVTVREGKVRVAAETFDKTVVLTAGESAHLSAAEQLLQKRADADGNATAWQRGYFRFTDTRLGAIAAALSDHYDVPISVDPAIADCTLSGRYTTTTELFDLLQSISRAFDADLTREKGGAYRLRGGRCQ